jgi:hypothetical protein
MDVGAQFAAGVFFLAPRQSNSAERRQLLVRAADVTATLRGQMKTTGEDTQKPEVSDLPAELIDTLGEVFADGCFIEAVHDSTDRDALQLMLFDGKSVHIASLIEHEGGIYVAREIDPSIVRELCLPTEFRASEPVPQLLADVVKLIRRFTGLPDKPARLVARFPLSTWVVEARRVAPYLLIVGPDCREVTQLLALLRCLCRHPLALTEVSAGGLCSLPMDLGLTLLIDQPELSEPVQRILNASQKREQKFPRRGGLWRPFCSKAAHCAGYFQPWAIGAVKIPLIPIGRTLPALDERELVRIANDFQPRLLSYRFATFLKAQESRFDNSISDFATRETINTLAACTPENTDLQAEIVDLVADQMEEVCHARWTDPTVILIESLLLLCHLSGEPGPYVGQVTDTMKTLFSARGEEKDLKPNQVGSLIRRLGLETEPRDKHGIQLLLTETACRKIHELARNFAVPSIENPVAGCMHCAALGKNKE